MMNVKFAVTMLLCTQTWGLRCDSLFCTETFWGLSVPTIGEGGDTTIPSPGMARKQPLPGIRLHDALHDRQACPEFNSFHQGVGQISPPERLFSCRPLSKRGQVCYIPAPPPPIVERLDCLSFINTAAAYTCVSCPCAHMYLGYRCSKGHPSCTAVVVHSQPVLLMR